MPSGNSLTSKLYDKIIKMLSKSHETIPLSKPNTKTNNYNFQAIKKVTKL
jgi:hypothetical protein